MEHSIMPPCEATGPDGSRLLVRPHATTDSVADLARALDLPAATPLAIDFRPVAPHERLVAAGLRVGSAVTISTEPHPPDPSPPATGTGEVVVAVLGGPACERWSPLPPGRHSVGRAAAATVRVDDPAVELHHGVLDVEPDGTVTFTQLTGAFPATVDGVPCSGAHPLAPTCILSIGASRLVIRHGAGESRPSGQVGGSIVAIDRDPWRRVVRRGPSARSAVVAESLVVPEPPGAHRAPPLTSLVGAGVAAAGAGLLAAVLGQLLFAVFAAVGAVASVATWAAGALVARRDRRRGEASHRAAIAAFEQALIDAHTDAEARHRSRHRDVVDALEVIHGDGGGVWSRRCAPSDVLWTTIGRGTCRWSPPIDDEERGRLDAELLVSLERCERLADVAVPLALEPGSVVALHGLPARTVALARSVIVQLAASYGPADWQLQVVTSDPARWSWTTWLPHAHRDACVILADDAAALAAAMNPTGGDYGDRRTVVVLDAPSLLSARTGPVRRRLERGDVTCVALVAPDATVPAVVDRILEVGATGRAAWVGPDDSAWTSLDREIVVAGISEPTAEAAARRLAPLVDPEDHDEAGGIPASVSLGELEPVAADAAARIVRRWQHGGRDPAPVARLGMSSDGTVDVDLVRDGPHGLIAGTTGSGKSELLRTLVVSLAAQCSPDHVTMILVDFKGGSTFDTCARLPHTVGVVTDLDDGLAERVLVSLDAEVRRRERLLRAAGVDDLTGYRRAVDDPLPRLVVVVDEFATLAKELPDVLGTLVSIAQRGRSLGIHLLLATQRPAGVVTDDIRANTNLRIALRLHDRTDSDDVVGHEAPARFPAGLPGRAALRLGPDDLVIFQTASTAGSLPRRAGRLEVERVDRSSLVDDAVETLEANVLDRLVDSIGAAAAMCGIARPHRPWIDALPEVIRRSELGDDPAAVGLLDDPAGQCRRPLTWRPGDGSLLLVGAVGAGTTTAACTVVASCARASPPEALHLYVVDAQGDPAWAAFESVAHCGAAVRVTEVERLTRLLGRLADELDRRVADGRRDPTVVLVLDGYAAVRAALDDVTLGEAAMRLDRLLRDGPAVGVVAVVTTDGSSTKGLVVPRSATWVFHVDDPGAARTVGLRAAVAGPGRPGRLRVVESGLEGHVALDPEPLRGIARVAGDQRLGPAPVMVLPDLVDPDELDARTPIDAGTPMDGRTPIDGRTDGRCEQQPVELLVGLGADDLEPAQLRVPTGDHVFIAGSARTGRSTALRQIEAGWRRAHPGGRVLRLGRHQRIGDEIVDGDASPFLVVVDDADRVDDPDGRLARLVAQHRATLAVAVRLEAARVAYGHWTREVARSRCGLIMTSTGDTDGELLGVTLPRRSSIPARPGLAWMVDQRGHRLVQVAARMPP